MSSFGARESPLGKRDTMSFEEALQLASRDDKFKATVYAMNTLLIHKGIYSQEEFQHSFVEWVEKEQRRSEAASSFQGERRLSPSLT
ncbi:MAG TPA: hypothetical protein VM056_02750 [Terriglobales bacterium]|nr:hypothetical protein [Terriglobales bacterium]